MIDDRLPAGALPRRRRQAHRDRQRRLPRRPRAVVRGFRARTGAARRTGAHAGALGGDPLPARLLFRARRPGAGAGDDPPLHRRCGDRSAARTTTCTRCSRAAVRRSRATGWPDCCAPRASTDMAGLPTRIARHPAAPTPKEVTMITVTPSAAQQIRIAATQSDADEMGLRIAARRDADGSLHYAMGFDEARDDDLVVPSEGIALVVSPRAPRSARRHDARLRRIRSRRLPLHLHQSERRGRGPARADGPGAARAAPQGCGSGGCGCGGR